MMEIDGNIMYTLDEACDQTLYTKGTLTNYLYSGIIDGQKMDDGQWFITKRGMIQLRHRKKLPQPEERPPDLIKSVMPVGPACRCSVVEYSPDPAPEKRNRIYLETETYDLLKGISELLGIPPREIISKSVNHYVNNVISSKLLELKRIDETRRKILSDLP